MRAQLIYMYQRIIVKCVTPSLTQCETIEVAFTIYWGQRGVKRVKSKNKRISPELDWYQSDTFNHILDYLQKQN